MNIIALIIGIIIGFLLSLLYIPKAKTDKMYIDNIGVCYKYYPKYIDI